MSPRHDTEAIRNIALVGNSGTGKTSLVEALFVAADAARQKGSVARGTTRCDFLPQERALLHSLSPAVCHFEHAGCLVNLIDAPGAADLIGRAFAVLPAIETVAIVVDALAGPDMVARRMMAWAEHRGLDRLIIINRIDAEGAALADCLARVQASFGGMCLPLNLPAEGGRRVVDCYFAPDGAKTDFSSVAEAHTRIIDQVVELDAGLMEVYLEQGEQVTPAQLHAPFEQALREGHLVPVCFASAETDAGIPELLRIFCELMPNPTEGTPPQFLSGEGSAATPVQFTTSPDGHVVAHVFRVSIDPFLGRLAMFRVHQGTVTRDSQLFIGDARKPFKVGHLFKVQGKDLVEVEAGGPGDILAVTKVEGLEFDAVLHDAHEDDHIHLRPIELPSPMQGLAVHAKSRGDEQKISDALHKLAAEDPSLRIEHNAVLNETVLRGLGELHLRVLLTDLKDRFHVDVDTSPPKVPYRETITVAAEGHYRHKKQTGGAGQFGEVYLRVAPLARGEGFRFVDAVVGGAIPRQFLPAVEKGVRQVLGSGVIAGFPLGDLEVTVYDGKHHPVDSKEVAFVTAARKAFIDAVRKARPVVLEPVVDIEITAPNPTVGDITRDLATKRARINATEGHAGGLTAISAQAPLRELNGYQTTLKALTAGAGSFALELSHYDPVVGKLQDELCAAHRPVEAED